MLIYNLSIIEVSCYLTSAFLVGLLIGARIRAVKNLPSGAEKPENETTTDNNALRNSHNSSNMNPAPELLETLHHVFSNLSHELERPLHQLADALQKIENMHNFSLERSRFLAKSLGIDITAFDRFFIRYSYQTTHISLRSSYEKVFEIVQDLKPKTHELLKDKRTFSIKTAMHQVMAATENLQSTRLLIQLGMQGIQYKNNFSEDMHFFGTQKHFVHHMISIIDLMLMRTLDFVTLKKISSKPTLYCEMKDDQNNSQFILKLKGAATENWLQNHSHQLTSDAYNESIHLTVKALMGLLHLNSLFQMTYLTENTPDSIETMVLTFPTNLAINNEYKPRKTQNTETCTMRDNPLNNDFLESLSEDLDIIKTKNTKENITFH